MSGTDVYNTKFISAEIRKANIRRIVVIAFILFSVLSAAIVWKITILNSIKFKTEIRDTFFLPEKDESPELSVNFNDAKINFAVHRDESSYFLKVLSSDANTTGKKGFTFSSRRMKYSLSSVVARIFKYNNRSVFDKDLIQGQQKNYNKIYRLKADKVEVSMADYKVINTKFLGNVVVISGSKKHFPESKLVASKITSLGSNLVLYNFTIHDFNKNISFSGGKTTISRTASRILISNGCKYFMKSKNKYKKVKANFAIIALKNNRPQKISFYGNVVTSSDDVSITTKNLSYDVKKNTFEINDSENMDFLSGLNDYSDIAPSSTETGKKKRMKFSLY